MLIVSHIVCGHHNGRVESRTETAEPAKLKMFIIWPFAEESANL